MLRPIILYVSTLLIMVPLDILFLGILAKGFFQSQVGQMMGELNAPAAILFYLMYAAAIVVFVNGNPSASWQHTLLFGALLGIACYATFDLTALSILKGWNWKVAAVDISWGAFVTAASGTLGLLLGQWFSRQF